MPVGGKLVLKGGLELGVKKPKKSSKKSSSKKGQPTEEELAAQAISVQGKTTYEGEFALEMARAQAGKAKATPWGSGYSKPPEVLHGYTSKVTGKTAEERLDLRAAMKSDKFCK